MSVQAIRLIPIDVPARVYEGFFEGDPVRLLVPDIDVFDEDAWNRVTEYFTQIGMPHYVPEDFVKYVTQVTQNLTDGGVKHCDNHRTPSKNSSLRFCPCQRKTPLAARPEPVHRP